MTTNKTVKYFIAASLIGTGVFLLLPYAYVVVNSFIKTGSGSFAGLDNYAAVLNSEAFMTAMGNTALFMAVSVPVILVLSLLISVYIYENPRLAGCLKTSFLIPMAIPVTSVVLMWRFLFDDNGIINGILNGCGMDTVNWMNTEAAFWILVLSYVWKNLGYNIILWLAALSAIDPGIGEAARIDGAGGWQRLTRVTLPAAKNGAFVIIVLAALSSFKVFREAYLVAGEYPHDSIYMVQHIFNNWFRNLEIDKLAAGAVINSLILIVLVLLLQRFWERQGDDR
ncbi:MAG: sugar ABC transporter permease [Clostridiales bacterium]|nr:sugar ABC transporter permease [Bacillota bacterium]MEE0517143.1 sugar ABC transporter permease [Anaerovoracaceae bacterium]PWL94670.1 MAG: sugar ABC transporter permease [Clostridiales bacterium]